MIPGRIQVRRARVSGATCRHRRVAAAWLVAVCSVTASCSDTTAQAAQTVSGSATTTHALTTAATEGPAAISTTRGSLPPSDPSAAHPNAEPGAPTEPIGSGDAPAPRGPVSAPVSHPPVSSVHAAPAPLPRFDALWAAASDLSAGNHAASVSVWRGNERLAGWATGTRVDGEPASTDTAFVLASVSKLITALTIARLVESGTIDLAQPVPWDAMGVAHEPGWTGVTGRELLAHGSGMPVNQKSWLDEPGSCRIPLEAALAAPPTETRGTWRYSNGNYCALGLLIEHTTGTPLDEAARDLVLSPADVTGAYQSTEGIRPTSAPYAKGAMGVERLDRLGGAGTWMASSDDIAAVLGSVTAADRATLQWPGIIVDRYGWGHTGSVDGAAACAWVLDEGATVLVALVSGPRPATGGALCDRLVPALAADLGVWAGEPIRSPL